LADDARNKRFEQAALPHLDAAFSLARWLTRNDQDAEDVVQEAFVRALRFIDSYQGGSGRAWTLAIVRNTCFSWLEKNRPQWLQSGLDVEALPLADESPSGEDPARAALRNADRDMLARALDALPVVFREAIVLRELEDFSYKDMAQMLGVPIGTVMSRLARARRMLRELLGKEAGDG
jgi:RNA polymerase sigma-70 factor, ECF subfamily